MIGKTLGKYRFVEKIGRGGMGIVYRAVDETLDREVAIKVISPELVEDDLVRRFRAEAQTLARVNHANIATVHELFREGDQLLMVMELVRGQSFEQLLERSGPLAVERAGALAAQVLDALAHAHRAGIVHRDLKPANLMLTEGGVVKVMDFGIARVSGTERMTTDGMMVGTPAYMAPEQVRGEDVDGRTDLYALGVVFYRMLTGKLPFKAENAIAMIQSQLNTPPTPARQVRPDLPEWLDAVLARALAKHPGERYQSAEEFRRALESVAPSPDDLTVALSSAHARAATPSPASAATPAAPGTATLVLSRSHLAVVGAVGLLLVVAIGLLAWAVLRPVPPAQVVNVSAAVPQLSTQVPAIAPPAAASVRKALPPPPVALPAPDATRPSAAAQPATQTQEAAPAPTVTPPPADALPFPERGRRGGSKPFPGRGRGGPPPASAPAHAGSQPMVFQNVWAIVLLRGGNRMADTTLTFDDTSMTFKDPRNGVLLKSFPYDALQLVFLSRSRLPRGAGGAELEIPGGMPPAAAKGQGPRSWLTLRTAEDRLVLRLEPPAVRPIMDLIQRRTKATFERFEDPQKP